MERITRLNFLIAALIVIAASLFLYSALSRSSAFSQRLYQTHQALDILHQIREDYLEAELTARSYASSQDPAELEKNARRLARIDDSILALKPLVAGSPVSQQQLHQLTMAFAKRNPMLDASSLAPSTVSVNLPLAQERVNFFQHAYTLESEELRVFRNIANLTQERYRATVTTLAVVTAIGLLLLMAGYRNIVLQIRARAKSEQQQRQSNALLRLTADSVEGMIVYIDRDQRYQFHNKAYAHLVGRADDAIVGATVEQVLGEDLYAQSKDLIEQALAGQAATGKRQHVLADGSTMEVHVSYVPHLGDDGTAQGFFGQITDITKFRRKEALLLEKTTFQKAILDSAHFSIITVDCEGIIRSLNVGAERMLGYSADELIGKATPARYHDEEETRARAHAMSLELGVEIDPEHSVFIERAKRGQADEGEWIYVRKDGSRLPVFLSITALRAGQDEVIGYLGIAFDITRQKETEAQLKQARAEAEAASSAKSAFLATMSHEIRTPMNGVLGVTEVLARTRLAEHQADMVQTIRDSAGVLLDLIDDILDFSKIEAGRLELERAPLSIRELVEGICTSLLPVAAAKGVELGLFVSPDIPEQVMSDDVRLRQILYNLMGNAIKFSGDQPGRNGQVRLRAEVVQATPLQIAFRIIDNGIGMTPQARSKLFTAFTQAEASTTRRFGGTGLGLAICKRLVELAQGEIVVDSTPGVGSTFTVRLPFTLAAEQPPLVLPDLTGLACIIVEDQHRAAADLCAYLAPQGAQVRIAADLADAARLATGLAAPVVVVHDARDRQAIERTLEYVFAGASNVRHLLLTRGGWRQARIDAPDVVSLDADALLRQCFLRAVAVAAGRASPEIWQDLASHQMETEFAPPSIAEARAQGRLILVAEDDLINQKVILRQLGLLGYAAELAGNGAEALRLWRSGKYALLLTDLHMPELDGYGLTKAIRAEEPAEQRLPILALTADALRGESRRASAAGMDDYLTKPVLLDVLQQALEKWMPPAAATAPAALLSAPYKVAEDAGEVDVGVLIKLVGADGDVVRELLTDYLRTARQQAAELKQALEAGNIGLVGALGHKLKSSSRSVGALALGDVCAEMENAGKAANKDGVLEAWPKFEAALAAAEKSIGDLLAKWGREP